MSTIIKKVWGTEEVLVNNEKYCAKILTIQPGGKSSLHFHKVKDETFIVRKGACLVQRGAYDPGAWLCEPYSLRFRPGEQHRFSVSWEHGPCEILEVSTPHDDADVVRIEPSQTIS